MDLIKKEQCILLDASSTVLELANKLKKKTIRLTVLTNGIETALTLNENPNITVILIGGIMTKKSSSIEGLLGVNVLEQVYIDMMFTSASGFTIETGLTDFNIYEVQLKREFVKKSKEVIALIDHTKINNSSSAIFADTDQISKFITDSEVDYHITKEFRIREINLIN